MPLAPLLLADVGFIAGDLLVRAGLLTDDRFLLSTDRGYAEIFQYLKFGWLAALLAVEALRRGSVASGGWAVVFSLLLIDDSFMIHERAGLKIARLARLPAFGTVRPGDLGELLYSAVFGAAIVCLAVFSWWRGSARDARICAVVVGGLSLVAVFGVGVDLLHQIATGSLVEPVAAVVEDGGELLATSVLASATLAVLMRPQPLG